MANLGNTFDPNNVAEDDRSFDPLPAGDYDCQITDSEMKETRSGGEMLKLTLEVISGPYANRKVWDNLNIRNANPQAQQIAHRALADLCAACGVGPITDSEDLHFKPFVATLKINPAKGEYDASNGVKRYKGRGGQPPANRGTVERPAPAAAAAQAGRGATGSRPWAAKPAARQAEMDDNIPF